MKEKFRTFLPVVPALIIFAFIAYYLNFTQDDAYISYRYVANFLNHHGLVYNFSERVQGYTNFGWVIYMLLWGGLGLGYILVSKITGFLLGWGVIVVTFLIARKVIDEGSPLLRLVPVYLVAANLSLAYWSPAGLETAAFAFVASLSIYWYLNRNYLLIAGLTLAVWIRPEGAVIAGILMVAEFVVERGVPLFALRCAAVAFALSLPMLGFTQSYYGSIIPNPFFAKTSFNVHQFQVGLGYAWEFLRDYGLFGAGLVVPLLFYRKLTVSQKGLMLAALGYSVYVVMVGGDVLKIHRFFLPIVGVSSVLLAVALDLLTGRMSRPMAQFLVSVAALGILALSIYLPYETVKTYNNSERLFTAKMAGKARAMLESDSTNFSAALPTIGAFGYELLGHDVIDMVGLTDSTIARHPEEPIPGMTSTWREQRFNSHYLLDRAPDYVVFSTGVKPSAPAEKSLMMYGAFQRAYRSVTWYYQAGGRDARGSLNIAYRKMRPVQGPIVADYPIGYVDGFAQGAQAYSAGRPKEAVGLFERAIASAPNKPVSIELLHLLGTCYGAMEGNPRGVAILNQAVAQDSLGFGPHRELYVYESLHGDPEKARIHHEYLKRLVPWYLPRIDSVVNYRVGRPGAEPPSSGE